MSPADPQGRENPQKEPWTFKSFAIVPGVPTVFGNSFKALRVPGYVDIRPANKLRSYTSPKHLGWPFTTRRDTDAMFTGLLLISWQGNL